jgi:hypothetical protein
MSPRAGEVPLFSPFSPIHRPNLGGQLKVDLPLSLRLQRMTGNCAQQTSDVLVARLNPPLRSFDAARGCQCLTTNTIGYNLKACEDCYKPIRSYKIVTGHA